MARNQNECKPTMTANGPARFGRKASVIDPDEGADRCVDDEPHTDSPTMTTHAEVAANNLHFAHDFLDQIEGVMFGMGCKKEAADRAPAAECLGNKLYGVAESAEALATRLRSLLARVG